MKHRSGSLLRLIANTEGQIFLRTNRGNLSWLEKSGWGCGKIPLAEIKVKVARGIFEMTRRGLVALPAILFSHLL